MVILESNVIEKINPWDKNQYDNQFTIKHLGLYIYITILSLIPMEPSRWHYFGLILDGNSRVFHPKYEKGRVSFKQQSNRACHSNNKASKRVKNQVQNFKARHLQQTSQCEVDWSIQAKQSSSSEREIKSSSNQVINL